MKSSPLSPIAAFARLLTLVACVVLLTSRIALLFHEFLGHGATAALFGGRVSGWYLFLFAGGRVSYETGELTVAQRLAISLGGILLETIVGAVAFLLARRFRPRIVVAFCLLCVGTVLVGHGAIYFARGVHYGFGDGAVLARVLGDRRVVAVLAASAVAITTAAAAGRRLARLPAAIFAGKVGPAAAALLVFALAGVIHGGLAWVEVRWFPDPKWAAIMQDASVVSARAELARRMAEALRRGETLPSAEDQRQMLDVLERARRPWPLDPILGSAVVAALVVGVIRGARSRSQVVDDEAARMSGRMAARIAVGLAGALAVILVLRHLSP